MNSNFLYYNLSMMMSQYYCMDESHLNKTPNVDRDDNFVGNKKTNKKCLPFYSVCSISSDSDLKTTKNTIMTSLMRNPLNGSQNFDESSLQISNY